MQFVLYWIACSRMLKCSVRETGPGNWPRKLHVTVIGFAE